MNERTEINEGRDDTRAELIDDRTRDGVSEDQPGERLTTKDMATGAAVQRAREESNVTPESVNIEERYKPVSERREAEGQSASPLFEIGESETFRSRWKGIQSQFVDEPRRSVEQADQLVAATMKRLAEIFANEREALEREWDRGEDISTEDLRIALQRYRSFFDRLLSV
jgi:hypothetical protein